MSEPSGFDAEKFKAATRTQWNETGGGWNAWSGAIRAWLAEATAAMLDRAGVAPGQRVLDVAAGAGDQTLDIARRVGSRGRVLATDLSPGILEFAKANARSAGLDNVDVKEADAEALGLDGAGFDAAVSRLGLMFCPNPLKALQELHRALKPGGRACAMAFSTPDKNPCVAILMSTALKHAGLPPRDPFQPGGLLSLGKPGLMESLFEKAGFAGVETTRLSAPFRLAAARDYLDFIRTSAGPILQILGRLDASGRQAAWAEVEAKLKAFDTADGWAGPNELLLTSGTK